MHVRVSPPAVATALRDSFRLQGLVSLLDEHGVVEVHDPRAASARDARLAITSAIGKWKDAFPASRRPAHRLRRLSRRIDETRTGRGVRGRPGEE
jgi:hypothetical protein